MDIFWQQIVIVVALIAAISYLVRRAIRRQDQKTACTRCPYKKTDLLDPKDLKRH
jgi:hypothetical protein